MPLPVPGNSGVPGDDVPLVLRQQRLQPIRAARSTAMSQRWGERSTAARGTGIRPIHLILLAAVGDLSHAYKFLVVQDHSLIGDIVYLFKLIANRICIHKPVRENQFPAEVEEG